MSNTLPLLNGDARVFLSRSVYPLDKMPSEVLNRYNLVSIKPYGNRWEVQFQGDDIEEALMELLIVSRDFNR